MKQPPTPPEPRKLRGDYSDPEIKKEPDLVLWLVVILLGSVLFMFIVSIFGE